MRKLHLGRETVSESTGSPLFGKSRADFTNLISSTWCLISGRFTIQLAQGPPPSRTSLHLGKAHLNILVILNARCPLRPQPLRNGTGRKAAVEHGWMQREVDSDEEEE